MTNKNYLSKSSQYVQSLVDFILDTKPYHSKLTSINEEYHFFDTVNVKIEEKTLKKLKLSSTWSYNYFSGGNPVFRTTAVHRAVSPAFQRETYIAGQHENIDLALVPHVFSKKSFDGVGVNGAYVQRANGTIEAMDESIDFFQSHGSFQFQIKRTFDANGELKPLWSPTNVDGSVAAATARTRQLALDTSNPTSAINQIGAALDGVQARLDAYGGNSAAQTELNALRTILAEPNLPQGYEALVNMLAATTLWTPDELKSFMVLVRRNSPPLFFGLFSDLGGRQTGDLSYPTTQNAYVRVTNLVNNQNFDFEEWTLNSIRGPAYEVHGSSSGLIGYLTAGEAFSHSRVSFNTTFISDAPPNVRLRVAPINAIVVHGSAPLETWNLIKVNPIAHSRAVLVSPRYGHIVDFNGLKGFVTILDLTLPTSDFALIARPGGLIFDLTSSAQPTHTGVVQVGVPFNDGRLAFTIRQGSVSPMQGGDAFYFSVENLPPRAENLDLGYGYDLDPYSDDETGYAASPASTRVGFHYDGRFTDYNLDSLGLAVTEAAVDKRRWRLKALPNGTFIAAVNKSLVGNFTTSYALPTNPTTADLLLYESNSFEVAYSDDNFVTSTVLGTVGVGVPFNATASHGVSFTIQPGSRPFVGASSLDTGPRVTGGDVFSFDINNPFPTLVEAPIGLAAARLPRLTLHSDSFHYAPAGKWTLTFSSASDYVLSGVSPLGAPLLPSLSLKLATPGAGELEGASFKGHGVHYTVRPGLGLAAGDILTFETYREKPSFLVHGSVSGWQKPATVGTYYWNGKIGFKVQHAFGTTYNEANELVPQESLGAVITIREDCPQVIYTFARQAASSFLVSRSDVGFIGHATTIFEDQYIRASLVPTTPTFKVLVDTHDFTLWNGQDLLVLKPRSAARLPRLGDGIFVEKTENDQISINLTPSVHNFSALRPVTIDQRFIDNSTNQVTTLAATSPETSILQGWLPLAITKRDSVTSIAEFSDPTTRYDIASSATGEAIGVLRQEDPANRNEPITFEWNEAFFNAHLPLNQEANLMFHGTGWNDKVCAHISEHIRFLIAGGALHEDYLFRDVIGAAVSDDHIFHISSSYADEFEATVSDGPFGGFLTGYDNLKFDAEISDNQDGGFYDAGLPLTDYFHQAQALSVLSAPTIEEQQRLRALIGLVGNFLNGSLETTTLDQFLANVEAGSSGPLTTADIGHPVLGHGFDIMEKPEGAARAEMQEALVIYADDGTDRTALMFPNSLPPVPASIPPGSTYESFETPLTAEIPVRVFEIAFNGTTAQLSALFPTFSVWLPGAASPQQVAAERVSLNTFRLSLPVATPAKILIA